MSSRERLDTRLVGLGLVESRERAKGLILAGLVRVDGEPVTQAGFRVREEQKIEVSGPEHPFVSRGGVKLAGALDGFSFSVRDRICFDVGASTGGFTDCLLQRGAATVHAVDVGYGQLAWKLREDPRVLVQERTNVRKMAPAVLAPQPSLAVIDASFISLRLLLAPTLAQLGGAREIIALVKPQFEVGREKVGKGGVVNDPELRREAVENVARHAEGLGLSVCGVRDSTLPGAKKGNDEAFLYLRSVDS